MFTLKPLMDLLYRYNTYTELNQFKSIMISTGLITSFGDYLTQHIERYIEGKDNASNPNFQQNPINKTRIAHVFLYGISFLGPFQYFWYVRVLPRLSPITDVKSKLQFFKKIALDQFVCCSTIYPSFLLFLTLLNGKSPYQEMPKIKEDFKQLVLTDICVWPWFQYFNFRFVQIHMQSIAVNIFSVFWNGYISFVHHSPPKDQGEGQLNIQCK